MSNKTPENNIANKSRDNFRLLSDNIFSLADKGKTTLDLLKDISSSLIEFANFGAIEIVYSEKNKIFHCDTRKDENPNFFCNIIKNNPETLKLSKLVKLPNHCDIFTGTFPFSYKAEKVIETLNHTGGQPSKTTTIIQLAIPVGDYIKGVALFDCNLHLELNNRILEFLKNFGRSLGLALSHNQSQFELRERVKELTCMYGISNLVAKGGKDLRKVLENMVSLLPPAWLYPEIAEARITLDDKQYSTSGFNRTNFVQSAEIEINGKKRGKIEVSYRESRPKLDEGVFLEEERHLIDSVAHEVALLVKRIEADKEKEKLQKQLQHADRLATIGQLAAGVAHELNEPLTGILGFAELLLEYDGISEQAKNDIKRIEFASLNAREIVRKLLLFARQIPTKSNKVNLNKAIKEVISFLTHRLGRNSIAVNLSVDNSLPLITADQAQIRQIFVNLFINAIHAMPKGGELSIEVTRTDNDKIKISITDTGTGMTERVMEKIFLPFFTTKEINQGTGLGLSVVHGIIEAHNGSITVESQLNTGTTFTIILPIEQENND